MVVSLMSLVMPLPEEGFDEAGLPERAGRVRSVGVGVLFAELLVGDLISEHESLTNYLRRTLLN